MEPISAVLESLRVLPRKSSTPFNPTYDSGGGLMRTSFEIALFIVKPNLR